MSNATQNVPAPQQQNQAPVKQEERKLGEFEGQNKTAAYSWYHNLVAWKMAKEIATLVAIDGMSDYGNAMASDDAKAEIKVKKADKDGISGFIGKSKSGKLSMSPAMCICRLAQQLEECVKEGLLQKADKDLDQSAKRFGGWEACLNPLAAQYLDRVKDRASKINWVE